MRNGSLHPVLWYISSHIDVGTDLFQTIRRIEVSELRVLIFAALLACARDERSSRRCIDARICCSGDRDVLSSLPSRVARLRDDEAFMKLFEDSSFDLTHSLPDLRRTQEDDWSQYS